MKPLRILVHFGDLEDPRVDRTKRHKLTDITVIAILAVICGADGWDQIEDWAEVRREWLETFLELPGGIPSADTFRRVFEAIDAEHFHRCFMSWMAELAGATEGKLICIDGKTARRSFAREHGRGPLHLVSAWVVENQLVLGQMATEEKSNEIIAIPELLKLLDLKGATISIDAIGCQKKIAAEIVDRKADYVLGLKTNQPLLHHEIEAFFRDAEKNTFRDVPHTFHEETDKAHGRLEIRRTWATSHIDWFSDKKLWKGLRSAVMVERLRTVGDKSSTERAFYITSHAPDAAKLASYVRRHWSIENGLHWTLDAVFHEDSSRIRHKKGALLFALLRKLALALLKRETSMPKLSLVRKRRRAGMDPRYLLTVLLSAKAPDLSPT